MELVSPLKFSMYFLSLLSASDPYSFQYVADVSPYLVTLHCANSESKSLAKANQSEPSGSFPSSMVVKFEVVELSVLLRLGFRAEINRMRLRQGQANGYVSLTFP
jgi:hypothetical protein